MDSELGTQRTPILVPNESSIFKKKFAANEPAQKVYTPNLTKPGATLVGGKHVNFIQRNIKRAGVSKDKYAAKAAKDKNYESTGLGAPERAIVSPKTYKEAPKNYGINSIGSIGSIGSPGSLSSQHLLASKKNLKKVRSKDGQNSHASNLHGQTGTTGGTGTLGGTTGGTTLSYRQLGNSLKTFRDQHQAPQA